MTNSNDAELIQSLFLSAKAQYEAALRRAGLLIAIAAVFHVTVFTPYIDAQRNFSAAKAEEQRLRERQDTLSEIGQELDAINNIVKQNLPKILDRHLEALKNDFVKLRRELADIKRGDRPEEISQIQQSTAPKSDIPPEVVALVREGAPFAKVRDALLPHIQSMIIEPRFQELNADWKIEVDRELVPRIKRLNTLQEQSPGDNFDEAARWASLTSAVQKIQKQLVDHTFTPPPGNNWWQTVESKAGMFNRIENFSLNNLQNAMDQSEVRQDIQKALNGSIANQEALLTEMSQQITQAEERFAKQSALLSELGSGFRAVALDLAFAVTWFPVLLWILFVYLSLNLTHRLRVYKKTAALITVADVKSREVLVPLALNPLKNAQRLGIDSAMRGAIACVWVVVAGMQLHGWDHRITSHYEMGIALSLILIILVQLFRYRILKPYVDGEQG